MATINNKKNNIPRRHLLSGSQARQVQNEFHVLPVGFRCQCTNLLGTSPHNENSVGYEEMLMCWKRVVAIYSNNPVEATAAGGDNGACSQSTGECCIAGTAAASSSGIVVGFKPTPSPL
jgi:hypothetical protein